MTATIDATDRHAAQVEQTIHHIEQAIAACPEEMTAALLKATLRGLHYVRLNK